MQKKNIPYIITYILTVLFFFLAAMFYRQSFFAILVLLLLVLPIFSLLFSTLMVRKLTATLSLTTPSVTKGHPIKIDFQLHNHTILPLLNGTLHFQFQNTYYENELQHALIIPMESLKKEPYTLLFDTAKVGLVSFTFDSFTATDLLHLHTFSIPLHKVYEVPVLPMTQKIQFPIPAPAMRESEEDTIFIPNGEQTGDIKELREYRPGDKLKDIHWKMTAKTDTLMVKEFEQAAGHLLCLLPELSVKELDDTIETFYNACHFLCRQREVFQVLIFNKLEGSFETRLITEEEQILPTLLRLYYAPTYVSRGGALAALKRQDSVVDGIMVICGKEILVNGHAIFTGAEGNQE